ncbi:dynactin subunit 5-like [Chrysoperla carnea]|uniref:dynactin subunit 5-like n=1 Tax=Chrysoperla carnea TaxID=189513 RepID=UPI001D088DB0|nr:dynactin subunit 5-like [Chrysoperla carnea]
MEIEIPDMHFNKNEYVETVSGNKISRQTVLCGSQNIILSGKVIVHDDVIIRGDITNIVTGRYCIIGRNSVLRGLGMFQLQIGCHVYIGADSIVNGAFVGSYVYIGNNVIIGQRCILKNCSMIADNTVLAPETTVQPYMRYEGSPAKCVGELSECMVDSMIEFTKNYYEHFTAAKSDVNAD